MKSAFNNKVLIARAVLNNYPAPIANALANDERVQSLCEISHERQLNFPSLNASFTTTEFYRGVRTMLNEDTKIHLVSADSREFALEKIEESQALIMCEVNTGVELNLPDLNVLSNNKKNRVETLEKVAQESFLSASAKGKWHQILLKRPLTDDEVETYLADIRSSYRYFYDSICEKLSSGKVNNLDLVPQESGYYSELVGSFNDSPDIKHYAKSSLIALFRSRISENAVEGLKYCLLLCWHSDISDAIPVEDISQADLEPVLHWLKDEGDPISVLAGIEVGVKVLPRFPDYSPLLLALVKKLVPAKLAWDRTPFELLSSLACYIDSDIAYSRRAPEVPPYYRRLAALTHASLLTRAVIASIPDKKNFAEWVSDLDTAPFYIQSLIDLRSEPRWISDLLQAEQLHSEICGRLINLYNKYKHLIYADDLCEVLKGLSRSEILTERGVFSPFLPGPLEGAMEHSPELPPEIAEILQLSAVESNNSDRFFALINSATLFTLDEKYSSEAAQAIADAKYHLSNIQDDTQLHTLLVGLARTAATSRSVKLAAEVRRLERRYRKGTRSSLPLDVSLQTCFITSASYDSFDTWSEFLGGWFTEISFGRLEKGDAGHLYAILQQLLHLEPRLWLTCSRAEAALSSLV